MTLLTAVGIGGDGLAAAADTVRPPMSIVCMQLPITSVSARRMAAPASLLRQPYGNTSRLVAWSPDGSVRVLSGGFHSAADPDISFDGQRVLFAAKRTENDPWDIYEMALDGTGLRQVTRDAGNCRSPRYQSTLYTIVSPEPWYQVTFVSDAAGTLNEDGRDPARHLYSCRADGSEVRRLTFNLSSDFDPFQMEDGRILFSSWQHSRSRGDGRGRIGLFAINLDGTDFARFVQDAGSAVKQMACVSDEGRIVFVESEVSAWDGAGPLSAATWRRPLKSHHALPADPEYLYHSPSPAGAANLLVSRRPAEGGGSHALCWMDLNTCTTRPIFDDPDFHEMHAVAVRPRPEPDGRSSVVNQADPHGKLYCLDSSLHDLQPGWLDAGELVRLRVIEGLPASAGDRAIRQRAAADGDGLAAGMDPARQVRRRILGEIEIEKDGSFNLQIPANTPIELQALDRDGLAVRSCGWIWARNREPRGCIGCHEDGERTPENAFVDALRGPSTALTPPENRRRTVTFLQDVMPIVRAKCIVCHSSDGAPPRLDDAADALEPADAGRADDAGEEEAVAGDAPLRFHRAYRALLELDRPADAEPQRRGYVDPGRARTSSLIWHVFGRNTSRPWDGPRQNREPCPIPQSPTEPLTDQERRTIVEWVDLGAAWSHSAESAIRP